MSELVKDADLKIRLVVAYNTVKDTTRQKDCYEVPYKLFIQSANFEKLATWAKELILIRSPVKLKVPIGWHILQYLKDQGFDYPRCNSWNNDIRYMFVVYRGGESYEKLESRREPYDKSLLESAAVFADCHPKLQEIHAEFKALLQTANEQIKAVKETANIIKDQLTLLEQALNK